MDPESMHDLLNLAAANGAHFGWHFTGLKNLLHNLLYPIIMIIGIAIIFGAKAGNWHKTSSMIGILILGLVVFALGAGGTTAEALGKSILDIFVS